MIELPLNSARFRRMVERLLVPRRIWRGGWCITVWNSRERCWEDACHFDYMGPGLDWGPFLRKEEKLGRVQLVCFRALYPNERSRLQRIGARWIIDHYWDIVRDPDHPKRGWFEAWGGGSPLWRMLGRQPK